MKDMNLAEARQNLPELTDKAYAGQTFVLARRGRRLAVLIGIDEYLKLKELEREQSEKDWELLLSPHTNSDLSEEDAIELAVKEVREHRQGVDSTQQNRQPE